MIWSTRCVMCSVRKAEPGPLPLCAPCIEALSKERRTLSHQARFLGLFRYRAAIRKVILQAKIRNDTRALTLIGELLMMHQAARAAATWADAIIVCPSSLWGRLRGRLDIAHHLAQHLSKLGDVPAWSAPLSLYWRIRKRAHAKGLHARSSHAANPRVDSHHAGPPRLHSRARDLIDYKWRKQTHSAAGRKSRVLVVDDIATTGYTLRSVLSCLPPECETRALSFAVGSRDIGAILWPEAPHP